MRGSLLVAAAFAALAACSASQVVEESVATRVEEPVKPTLVTNDPFDKLVERFEAAYQAILCRANRNFDPMSNVGVLVEPFAEVERLEQEKSKSLDPYLLSLEQHGYASLDLFRADRERISAARHGWWEKLTGSIFDRLEECGE